MQILKLSKFLTYTFVPLPATSLLMDFLTFDPIELMPTDLRSEFSDLCLKTRILDLGQLLQKALDTSDHSSRVLCLVESLSVSPVTRALCLNYTKSWRGRICVAC
jgi:hypothetical protein